MSLNDASCRTVAFFLKTIHLVVHFLLKCSHLVPYLLQELCSRDLSPPGLVLQGMVGKRKQAMTPNRMLPEEAYSVPRELRSRLRKSQRNYGASSSTAPVTMTTSTAAEEALVIGTSAPMAMGKEAPTSSKNNLGGLADAASIFWGIHTTADNTETYASEQEKLHQDFNMAVRTYASGRKKLFEEYKKAKLVYAAGKERLRRDLIDAELTYTSGQAEAARKLKMSTAGVR